MKSAEERIDGLERQVGRYRLLVFVMVILLVVIQRDNLGRWMDSAESWLSRVTKASAQTDTDAIRPRQ